MIATNTAEIKRSHDSMSKEFVTHPGDVFAILAHEGVICNTIDVQISNEETDEKFTISFNNQLGSWKTLKTISEFRAVNYERHLYGGKIESCKYVDSAPYKHRFA